MKLNRLKVVMAELGISQKALGEKMGVSSASISNLANNRSQPSLQKLFMLADALGVSPCSLINDGQTATRSSQEEQSRSLQNGA